MPYKTKKVGSKYCVYKKDGGKKVGCTKGTEEAKKKYLAALHIAEDEEYETKGDVEWIKKGEDINVKIESFKSFFESNQVKVRKGGAGKAFYTSTRVEKDKKKEQSKKQARGKVKPEDAEDRCKRKADSVYGKKTSAYKSGAIVRCRDGKIWKK